MNNTNIEIDVTSEQIKHCVDLYVRTKLSSASVEVFDHTLLENGDDTAALYAAILNEQIVNLLIDGVNAKSDNTISEVGSDD